ncbi:MAG TPA: MBL fold metallo-hydrolase [Frankiaceae bacterium]|nr:MBL fold metallo-hydrolase [Frankiaceae bacterium]
MRLTVLGCSGTFPGPTSACSSYLVEQDGFRLVVDVGNGSLGELQAHCGLLDVDAVLLSHLHADHFLDMVAYAYARRYHPAGMPPALPVYGPEGTRERLCAAFGRDRDDALAGVYDFRTVRPGRVEIGPFTVELARVVHPVEAYAARMSSNGHSLTYSGDTGACDRLVRLARDTDLFLCEASWLDQPGNPPGVHLSGREAGEHAARSGARTLLLTHLVPWGDPARSREEAAGAYDGTIEVAGAGRSYEV